MEYEITVTAASGVEGVPERELKRLGVEEPRAVGGVVAFAGDETVIQPAATCFCGLRTRVYLGGVGASARRPSISCSTESTDLPVGGVICRQTRL